MRVGKNVKSIEQSTEAYYLASGQIEKQLQELGVKLKTTPWEIT